MITRWSFSIKIENVNTETGNFLKVVTVVIDEYENYDFKDSPIFLFAFFSF
jgi:hypothetical protein